MENFQQIFDIIKNISLIAASVVAIYSINAWRREYIGRRKIELAEETLILFYEARDMITAIRNPVAFHGEGETREQGDNETPDEKRILDNAYVVRERYNKHQELFNKIYAMRYRYMARFGSEETKPFDDLHKVISDLLFASYRLGQDKVSLKRGDIGDEERQEFQKELREVQKIFWEISRDDDPLNPRINIAVEAIEKKCRSVIENRSN